MAAIAWCLYWAWRLLLRAAVLLLLVLVGAWIARCHLVELASSALGVAAETAVMAA